MENMQSEKERLLKCQIRTEHFIKMSPDCIIEIFHHLLSVSVEEFTEECFSAYDSNCVMVYIKCHQIEFYLNLDKWDTGKQTGKHRQREGEME